ncbi:MAG: NAD-dependent epimerase/dehydratase family protein [Anaerolineae bacterium]|nr:NAD-dependent epimerase/dehydratase family protein [Anaerolineae bacterium]
MASLPQVIDSEPALDALLSLPSPALIELMRRLDGDLIVLGIGGKMGATLGHLALRAIRAAGVSKRVWGVSRFHGSDIRGGLEARGINTIGADLLDRQAVDSLPRARNVMYMVGRKFGTSGTEDLTWATNVIVPTYVSDHFRDSRIVVFSTGCVYPLVSASTGGCTESTPPDPVGEYAQSCLGRERVFAYGSGIHGTPVCLLRLNYAVDLRYGVLHDIASQVYSGKPVDLSVSHFNVIWQGDAGQHALLALGHCASPPTVINVTGPELVSVKWAAERFAELFGVDVTFTGDGQGQRMYLNNAAEATALFGYPSVPLLTLIRWQAEWIRRGLRSLGMPTHYGVVDGVY